MMFMAQMLRTMMTVMLMMMPMMRSMRAFIIEHHDLVVVLVAVAEFDDRLMRGRCPVLRFRALAV